MVTTDSSAEPVLLTAAVEHGTFTLRRARKGDLPRILALLADDQLGATRENADDLAPYEQAFEAIDADPAHLLVVGELDGDVVATFQLSYLPGLSRKGSWRAQIEAVRVSGALRGRGVGALMIQWAVDQARENGCSLVQLTTDKSRIAAHRFYERLGFAASHEGMKLTL
ncbi:GNAT family N-acetyltransferase [Paenarthrobacter aurescens]|uniref:GNAT family acetyltransferase n=1 Tax=Paenarthrobacter aurescens TaxID=43663 RepID=A0A4Y3NLQ4_PAEAU|nr:GNAT family N-acetyltransferase [Paenarthrobacter aurescens]MDO6145314.1 GNAT family N-acetyltransferase [Paenarthrobacter aurescens]MDO6149119.1 GNAT family N-acetyltransferase [Paenarthrobacter aurescens]MDO6160363.1 GNAT family N-acetyltransferase [Paenarthrobacter aurescens]MDO6164222.1 GNAT family N-acetyltransferase [Paenarthrobacter aurescens]GEB19659.1 GNAT family acetyltransferase [Paenarthrobacter aurescens]